MIIRATVREIKRRAFRAQVAQEIAAFDVAQIASDLHGKEFRESYLDSSLAWVVRTQVRLIREDRGWTQEELAEKSGVSFATINRIESKAPLSIQISTLLKLAQAFDCALVIRFESWGNYLKWLLMVKIRGVNALIPKPFPETIAALKSWARHERKQGG